MKRLHLLLLLFCLFSFSVFGDSTELGFPRITNYEPEQYNAHPQCWVIEQDLRGVMYFGNRSGILQFDGVHWSLIPVPSNARVRALVRSLDGTIFYGSAGDFGFLEASPAGRVTAVSLRERIDPKIREFNDVYFALANSQGVFFFTRTRIYHFQQERIRSIKIDFATSQPVVVDDHIFFVDSLRGLCLIENDRVVPLPRGDKVYNQKRVCLAPFPDRRLLIARSSGDFLVYDLRPFYNAKLKRYDFTRTAPPGLISTLASPLGEYLREENLGIYKLIQLDDQTYAFASIKGGFSLFDRQGNLLRIVNHNTGLIDDTVSHLYLDESKNIWVTTTAGISYVETGSPVKLIKAGGDFKGFVINCYRRNEFFYAATFQTMVAVQPQQLAVDSIGPVFIPVKNGPRETWQFKEVAGDLIVGSGQGVFKLDRMEARLLANAMGTCYSLGSTARFPEYLFAGAMDGLYLLKKQPGKLSGTVEGWRYLGRIKDIRDTIRDIVEDDRGDLWMSTEVKGLIRIHFTGSTPEAFELTRFGATQGLPELGTHPAFHGGELYVGTAEGLFKALFPSGQNGQGKEIRFVPEKKFGMDWNDPPIPVKEILFESRECAWFNTARGIIRCRRQSDGGFRAEITPFRNIPNFDGRFFLEPQRTLWIPNSKALYSFDMNVAKKYDAPFHTLITRVTAAPRHVIFEGTFGEADETMGDIKTRFSAIQPDTGHPVLPYSENALTFEYASVFFEATNAARYKFRLEGFDPEWSDWTSETRKEYTNLSEGKYRFLVKAMNVYGTESRIAGFKFRILPPWYRRTWAFILWGVGFIAGILSLIFAYTRKLQREKKRLEKLVAERTRELKEISLTDPLTGLHNRRFIRDILAGELESFLKKKCYFLEKKPDRRHQTDKPKVFGVLIIDIDHFKTINDQYGHDIGDKWLMEFSKTMKNAVRADDEIIRYGGEEFLVILKNTSADSLSAFTDKLKTELDRIDHLLNNPEMRRTCSIGFTRFPLYESAPRLLSFEDTLLMADLALYFAKKNGRNMTVEIIPGNRIPEKEQALFLIQSLDFGIENDFIRLVPSTKSSAD